MQCTNLVKQLSLSLHNYHDVQGGFPAGANTIVFKTDTGGTNVITSHYFTGLIQLFPFIELNARYDAIYSLVLKSDELDHAGGRSPCPWQAGNASWVRAGYPVSGNIGALICPSDITVKVTGNTVARTSYTMCRGDVVYRETGSGAFSKRGTFGYLCWQKMGSIEDGTSNTIGFSEAIPYDTGRNVKGRLVVAADSASLRTNPLITCGNNVLDTNDRKLYTGTIATQQRCSRFCDARCYMGFFNTVNQPNAPSCTNVDTDGTGTWGVWAPSSFHSGGVNCGLVDGSVRFISDTVNNTTSGLDASPTEKSAGKSEFGVWGAYGSIDGGESTTL
ncbi:MAG: DUF1559 domain-containing protein [Planctomycetaceae bacterium]|nr:DUF1559 domain-containing protein [Planctomycetaceae bacterium]